MRAHRPAPAGGRPLVCQSGAGARAGPPPPGLAAAGNAAFTRIVRGAAVQRCGPEACDCPEEERAAAGRGTATSPAAPVLRSALVQRDDVQRACVPALPQECVLYEDWLSSFSRFGTFVSSDVPANVTPRNRFHVLGEQAATDREETPTLDPHRVSDTYIDRPRDSWVRANLPPSLRTAAYQLPSDCADMAVILRHVWLFENGRTENYRGWQIGAGVTPRRIHALIRDEVGSGSVSRIVAPYTDRSGTMLRSFDRLQHLLHPGDVLVWEHRRDSVTGRRTGGHTQTIETVNRANGTITSVTLLQGNQPIFAEEAQAIRADLQQQGQRAPSERSLRDAPGRRIERDRMQGADFGDIGGTWAIDDGVHNGVHEFTVLVAAGPPSALRARAPGRGGQGRNVRRWIPLVRSQAPSQLGAVLEAACAELRAGGEDPQRAGEENLLAEEAAAVGQALGERIWQRARQRARSSPDLAVGSHFEPLTRLRDVIDRYRALGGTDQASRRRVEHIFDALRHGLDLGGSGGSSVRFPRSGPRGRLRFLVTGFEPFAAGRPPPEAWNTSGPTALALDDTEIRDGGRMLAHVQSVVLPVDFRSFHLGLVERIVGGSGPFDAVVTVSMDRGLSGEVALERYAVNFHDVRGAPGVQSGPIPLPAFPVPAPASAAAHEGAAIVPAWSRLGELSHPGSTGGLGARTRSTGLGLRFDDSATAAAAAADLRAADSAAAIAVTGADLRIDGPDTLADRLVGAFRPAGGGGAANRVEWPALGGGQTFRAAVVEGPGGDFLSNEVSYRAIRLLQQQQPGAASFHVHTPNAPDVPVAERGDRRSAAWTAATGVRDQVLAELRRLLRELALRLISARRTP
jgi:pyrrolidone-carboxylate peptidase